MNHARDIKKTQAWCWQDKQVMRLIRENYKSKRLTTSVAIYQSLTELASNTGSDSFNAYLSQIARLAGKSTSTIKKYTKELVGLGVLKIENRKLEDRINLPNRWILLTHSVSNSKPTSDSHNSLNSISNNKPRREENVFEINKLERKYMESDGYKKAVNVRNLIGNKI